MTQIFGEHGGDTGLFQVSPGQSRQAWATGYTCTAHCYRQDEKTGLLVEQRNGSAWRSIPAPGGLVGKPEGISISATGRADAWVAAMSSTKNGAFLPYILHWSHGSWAKFRFRSRVWLNQIIAFSDSNVWAFGATYSKDRPQASYDLHFNGKTWQVFSLHALIEQVSATGPTDIWGVGPFVGGAASQAEHWDGIRWHTFPAPSITESSTSKQAALISGIVALGPQNMWTSYEFRNPGGTCCTVGGLLHLSHGQWRRIAMPNFGTITNSTAAIAQDGQGGIWLVAPGWIGRFGGGHWVKTKVRIPQGYSLRLTNISWIPGSKSVLAQGWLTEKQHHGQSLQSAILEYS